MGLLQKAYETYDNHLDMLGKYYDDYSGVLVPIAHTLTNADIEITLDDRGNFISARKIDKKEGKVVIPVTEESAGRTSGPCPHPLCDQLGYLSSKNQFKHKLYMDALKQWAESPFSHPKVKAVYLYLSQDHIFEDLEQLGLAKMEDGSIVNEKDLIVFNFVNFGPNNGPCYTDLSLFNAFSAYYLKGLSNRGLCMVSGKLETLAKQHPKGIVAINGNAKIISANDSNGFTYRGRFCNDEEALSVGYEASQKAHSALRWLIGNGDHIAGRSFICWNPQGKKLPSMISPFEILEKSITEPAIYQRELKAKILYYQEGLPTGNEDVVVASFDAATPGRLSVAYYNELKSSDFLERLYKWDAHCCWWTSRSGINSIFSPSIFSIVKNAFGVQRKQGENFIMECDERILKKEFQELISCRINGTPIPKAIVRLLGERASNPQMFDASVWRRIVFTASSAINMLYYYTKGEDVMSWTLDKKDRSFQFGRLLAVLERAEADYYSVSGETRLTNAMKQMSRFKQRPLSIFEQINHQLYAAYLPRVAEWQRRRYEKLRDEIMAIIYEFPENEINNRLDDIYILGYEMQRNAFYKKNTQQEEE